MHWAHLLGLVALAIVLVVSTPLLHTLSRLVFAEAEPPRIVGTAAGHAMAQGEAIFWRVRLRPASPVQLAAARSCDVYALARGARVIVVDEANVSTLLSQIHPNFDRLSQEQQTLYLGEELLFEYGGTLLSDDVVCTQDFMPMVPPDAKFRFRDPESPLMVGPIKAHGELSQELHEIVWATLDGLTLTFKMCALLQEHAPQDLAGPCLGVMHPLNEAVADEGRAEASLVPAPCHFQEAHCAHCAAFDISACPARSGTVVAACGPKTVSSSGLCGALHA